MLDFLGQIERPAHAVAFKQTVGHFVQAFPEIAQFVIGYNVNFPIEIAVSYLINHHFHFSDGRQNGITDQKIEYPGYTDKYKA